MPSSLRSVSYSQTNGRSLHHFGTQLPILRRLSKSMRYSKVLCKCKLLLEMKYIKMLFMVFKFLNNYYYAERMRYVFFRVYSVQNRVPSNYKNRAIFMYSCWNQISGETNSHLQAQNQIYKYNKRKRI